MKNADWRLLFFEVLEELHTEIMGASMVALDENASLSDADRTVKAVLAACHAMEKSGMMDFMERDVHHILRKIPQDVQNAHYHSDEVHICELLQGVKLSGLPTSVAHIPVETVEKPAKWLKANGYEKVGVWGISIGAELAMLAGVCMPDLISCVIAASPICFVTQDMTKKNDYVTCSVFMWRSKDFPYVPYPLGYSGVPDNPHIKRQLHLQMQHHRKFRLFPRKPGKLL